MYTSFQKKKKKKRKRKARTQCVPRRPSAQCISYTIIFFFFFSFSRSVRISWLKRNKRIAPLCDRAAYGSESVVVSMCFLKQGYGRKANTHEGRKSTARPPPSQNRTTKRSKKQTVDELRLHSAHPPTLCALARPHRHPSDAPRPTPPGARHTPPSFPPPYSSQHTLKNSPGEITKQPLVNSILQPSKHTRPAHFTAQNAYHVDKRHRPPMKRIAAFLLRRLQK
ncbi:hypothetical protein DFJ73DRAFT_128122 [Zopfochytrium polystomum]|nr:hypothetical protein DFJ73DRAFT_128122 [Zopfochytrium polystomum]